MLAVSWVLFLRMGTASFEQSDIVQETQNTQEMQEEDWSGEIFGVEVRVQDGRIVFFRKGKGGFWKASRGSRISCYRKHYELP